MVLVVVSLLVPVAERFRLPHTVLLAIAGMGLGFLGSWIISSDIKLGALGDAFIGLDKLEVGSEVFLPLFLPPEVVGAHVGPAACHITGRTDPERRRHPL